MIRTTKKQLLAGSSALALAAAASTIATPAYAAWTTLAAPTTVTQTATGGNIALAITSTANNLDVAAGAAATNTNQAGSTIAVTTTAAGDIGIRSTDATANAIAITGTGTLTSLNITQGKVTGAGTTNVLATVLIDGTSSTTAIKLGNATSSDGAGTSITNTGGGAAIELGNTNAFQTLTIDNTHGGSITSTGDAIVALDKASAVLTVNSNGTITAGTGKYAINLNGTTNTKSVISLTGGTVTGAIDTGTKNTSTLSLAGGQVVGTIDGATNLTVGSNYTTQGNIGNTVALTSTVINDGVALSLNTNNNVLKSGSVVVGSAGAGTAVLNIGTASVTGTIDGDASGKGTVNFKGTNTTVGNIGTTTNKLGTVNITDGATVSLNTNNNTLSASAINVGTSTSGATLNVGTGALTGIVNSSAAGVGTINFKGNQTLGTGTTIGATTGFGTVTVSDGAAVNANTNNASIKATNVVLGTAGAGTATLSLGTGSVTGTINGDAAGKGVLNFKDNNTTVGNIGATNKLSSVVITDGKTVTLSTNNNSLAATAITLGTAGGGGAALVVGTGAVVGTIDGDASGKGALTYSASQTLASDIGAINKLAAITINDGATINDLSNNQIKATTVTLGSAAAGTAVLTLGTTAVGGNIESSSAGKNTLNVTGTQTATGTIGAATSLGTINITDGTAFTLGGVTKAAAINIGTSSAGATLNTGANNITGAINSARAGTGTLNVTGNSTMQAGSSVGATTSLAAVNITDGVTFSDATANGGIKATQITLGSVNGTGTLTVGTGSVTGKIDSVTGKAGNGTVNFNGNNTLLANVGSTVGIGTLSVGAGARLHADTNNNSITATNVTVGNGSTLDVGTGVVTGVIDGSGVNTGTVNFTGTQTTGGAVGGANNLAAVNINGGVVSLGEVVGSTIKANVTTVNTGGTLNFGNTPHTTKGDIVTADTGALKLGTQTQNVNAGDNGTGTGAFTTAAGGQTVTIGIRDNVASHNGNLNIAGNATVDGSTKLVVDTSLLTTAPITSGTTYNWLTTAGTNTGAPLASANVSVLNPLFTVAETKAATTRTVTLTRVAGGYGTIANNSTDSGAGAVLESLVGVTANAQLITLQTKLDSSSSAAQLNATLNSAVPQVNQSSLQALQSATQSMDVVGSRLSQLRAGIDTSSNGMAAGGHVADKGLWIQAFGTTATQDTRSNVVGYDADTAGAAVGGDIAINDTTRLGASFSYANSNIDGNGSTASSTDINSYQLNAYGTHMMGQWYTDGLLGAAYHNYNSDRTVAGVGIASSGDFSGETYTARVGGGYHFLTSNGIDITPNMGLTYYYNHTESYTESGVGGLNNSVGSSDQNALIGKIGADVGYSFNYGSTLVRPVVRAAYLYDFVGDQLDTTSQFTGGGATFKVRDASPERSSFDLGASLNLAQTNNVSFSADYDFQAKTDYTAHSGMLRARYNF